MREFFTRTKNEKGYATLYTRIRKRSPKVDIFVNSLIQVDIIAWKKAKSGLDEWNKFLKTKDGKEIYSKMQDVDNAIDNLTEQGIYEKSLIDEAVANVIYKEMREQQRIKEEEERKAKEEQERMEAEKEAARKADHPRTGGDRAQRGGERGARDGDFGQDHRQRVLLLQDHAGQTARQEQEKRAG